MRVDLRDAIRQSVEDVGKLWVRSELPVLVNGLDGPIELLTKCLGEEFLDWDVELLGEDDSQARVDIVLSRC